MRPALSTGKTITIGVNGGTLQALGAAGTGDLFLDGQLTGSGALNVLGGGGAIVRFTNANGGAFGSNTYTGTLTIANASNALIAVDNITALAGASVVNLGRDRQWHCLQRDERLLRVAGRHQRLHARSRAPTASP